MKKISQFLCVAAILDLSAVCYSQNIAPPYEVGTWSGFHSAAVSYTFDDDCNNQLRVAVPMFNSYGFRLTLFTVINWEHDWVGLQKAASRGHEIGSHTVSHPRFDTVAAARQRTEMSNSASIINSNITGQKCISFSYPYGVEGADSLCSGYFVAARSCMGFIGAQTPKNFMDVNAFVCGDQGAIKTIQDFETADDRAASSKGWLVYVIHGIDNDGGYSPLPSTTLKASLEYLKARKELFWVSTFGNVARYIKERNCLSVTETSYQDIQITLEVTDTLDNTLYNVPVTIRRPLPQDWSAAIVTQNGLRINASIVIMYSIKYVMFDAVPNGGEIKLLKTDYVGAANSNDFSLSQNNPNPFNPATAITFSIGIDSHVSLRVYDLIGREVATLVDEQKAAGTYTEHWNALSRASGFYVYKMEAGNFTQVKKLLFLK
jgi:oligosaccharide reducing-end xylanase